MRPFSAAVAVLALLCALPLATSAAAGPVTWVVAQLAADSVLDLGPGMPSFTGVFGTGFYGKALAGAYVPSLDAVLFVSAAQCVDMPPFVPQSFNGTHDVHRLFKVQPSDADGGAASGSWQSTEEEGAFVASWPLDAPPPCCLKPEVVHGGDAMPDLFFLTALCFADGSASGGQAPVPTFLVLNLTSHAWSRVVVPEFADMPPSGGGRRAPSPSFGLPFFRHAMAAVDTAVYMYGGVVPGSFYESPSHFVVYAQASMVVYDVAHNTWTRRAFECDATVGTLTPRWRQPFAPFGQPLATSTDPNDACKTVYDDGLQENLRPAYWVDSNGTAYDVVTVTSLPCVVAPPLYGHSMVYDPSRRALLVFGGLKDGEGIDGLRYNRLAYAYAVDTDAWLFAIDAGEVSGYGFGAVAVTDNRISYLPGWRPLSRASAATPEVGTYSQALLTAPLSEFPTLARWDVQSIFGMSGPTPLTPRMDAVLAGTCDGDLLAVGGARVAEGEMHDEVVLMYASEGTAKRTVVSANVTSVAAGQTVAVRARVRDATGRALHHGRTVVAGFATHNGTGRTGPLTFAHAGAGVFEAHLYVTTAGRYEVTVLVNGNVVPGEPLSVTVSAGAPVPGRCAAIGVRASFGQAAPAANRFRVACLDAFNNAVELREDHGVTFALDPLAGLDPSSPLAVSSAVVIQTGVRGGGLVEYVASPGVYRARLSVGGAPALPVPLDVSVEPQAWQLGGDNEYAATRTVSLGLSRVVFGGLVAVCAFVAALAVACGACAARYHQVRVFKRAMPTFLGVMCAGIALYMMGIVGELVSTEASCVASVWLEHVGFSMYFAALALKTYRLERIFRNEKLRQLRLSNGKLATLLGISVGVIAIYLAAWMVADMPGLAASARAQTVRGSNGTLTYTTVETVTMCRWGVWQFALLAVEYVSLILLSAFCLRVLDVDTDFNESRFIAFTVWNFVVLGGLLVLIINFWTDSVYTPDFYYGLRAAGTCIPSFMALVLMFAPKVVRVYNGTGNLSAATSSIRPRPIMGGESVSSLAANSGRVSVSLSLREMREVGAAFGSGRGEGYAVADSDL